MILFYICVSDACLLCSDSVVARTLGVPMPVTGQMTYAACTTACYNAGYSIAGVEYADECCKYLHEFRFIPLMTFFRRL